MKKAAVMVISAVVGLILLGAIVFSPGRALANVREMIKVAEPNPEPEPVATDGGFEVEVLVDDRPLDEYAGRGRRYVEALEGEERRARRSGSPGRRGRQPTTAATRGRTCCRPRSANSTGTC